ncbi:MAG: alpha/beta fold hydrolase, partial [Myxococcota bacterium]
TIYYEVTGSGRAIVLGHSLLCDVDMWRGVAPRLAERHRVINVEVRGHRRSTAPAPFTLEDLASDWFTILDVEKVERAFLVGLSMGGMTAMRLALRAPSRVAGMVLIDSNGNQEEGIKRLQYGLLEAIYERFGVIGPVRTRTAQVMFGKTTLAERRELVDELVEKIGHHDRTQIKHALRAVFRRGPILDRLDAIEVPTLVLVGDEDRAAPVDTSRRLAAAIRGARFEVVPRVGHLSALEAPETIASRVTSFLLEHRW